MRMYLSPCEERTEFIPFPDRVDVGLPLTRVESFVVLCGFSLSVIQLALGESFSYAPQIDIKSPPTFKLSFVNKSSFQCVL